MKSRPRGRERRRDPRVALPCRLSYLQIPRSAEAFRDAAVEDLSRSGFRFRASVPFPRKSCFLLDLTLPGARPIRSLAKVAWTWPMPEEDGYQIGGMFVEPNAELGELLAHLERGR